MDKAEMVEEKMCVQLKRLFVTAIFSLNELQRSLVLKAKASPFKFDGATWRRRYMVHATENNLEDENDASQKNKKHVARLAEEDCTVPHTSVFDIQNVAGFVRPETFRIGLKSWNVKMASSSKIINWTM
ncbi:hypothetical protein ISN45_Aa04g003710 [Arabidopsis thaliana x Arabidopsis arenosa]|uniref:Uncharacterized protein n=1 Tax=Arabidopsis thaliana x Arabidopsis arenosa TaxID=1240361 RepID=A0A8T2A6E8_9BRAS|nr:hypothetical protein ISN45_Aa04g003710 [Arabidopsis thaliana x Arabidopsis arenosa]